MQSPIIASSSTVIFAVNHCNNLTSNDCYCVEKIFLAKKFRDKDSNPGPPNHNQLNDCFNDALHHSARDKHGSAALVPSASASLLRTFQLEQNVCFDSRYLRKREFYFHLLKLVLMRLGNSRNYLPTWNPDYFWSLFVILSEKNNLGRFELMVWDSFI